MANLILTGKAQAVVDNLVATLTALQVDGKALFSSVGVFDDAGTFERVADGLSGVAAGVIVRQPERGDPMDNGDDYVERLAPEVAIRFTSSRLAGKSETAAVAEMQKIAEAVRAALLQDKSRGGAATLITWNGKMLAGTDVTGALRTSAGKPGEGFYTVFIPVAVGWTG